MIQWPLTEEQQAAVLENDHAVSADELEGEWVRVTSSESGVVVGRCRGVSSDGISGINVFVQTGAGHTGRHVCIDNLQRVQKIEYVTAPGDGTSHGATWLHFLEAMNTSWQAYIHHHLNGLFDTLINMAGEGAKRDGGGWQVLLEHLLELQYKDKRYFGGALIELRLLAREFARKEHRELVGFAKKEGLPRPSRPRGL